MRKSTKTEQIESAEEPAVTVIAPDEPVLETPPAVEPEVAVAAATAKEGLAKLTKKEAEELEEQETVVKNHVGGTWEVAEALRVIQAKRLYKATHTKFSDYCLERWHFDRAHGDRLVKAGNVYRSLECLQKEQLPIPTTEAQVRPLTRLTVDKYEDVWRAAVAKAAGGPITMKLVEELAEPHRPKREAKAKDEANPVAAVEATPTGEVTPEPETSEAEVERLLRRLQELLEDCGDVRVHDALLKLCALRGLELADDAATAKGS
jgi:hypothetical protein